MSVSTVRVGLKLEVEERIPSARAPERSGAGRAQGGRGRAEAVAWVRRQLAWEQRLDGLREQAAADEGRGTRERPDAVPLAE